MVLINCVSYCSDVRVSRFLQKVLPRQTQWTQATMAAFSGKLCPQSCLQTGGQGISGVSVTDSCATTVQLWRGAQLPGDQGGYWSWCVEWYRGIV